MLKEVKQVFKRLHGVTTGHRSLEEVTCDYKRLQGVTKV